MDKKINDLKKSFDNIEVPPEVDLVIETAIKRGNKTRKLNFVRPLIATAACLLIIITAVGINKPRVVNESKSDKMILAQVLPKVGSYQNLQVLLRDFKGNSAIEKYGSMNSDKSAGSLKSAATSTKDSATVHSDTNQQVKGVDEGDNVKNDGEYIYKITGNKLMIIKAIPADKLQISSEITFEENFHPAEVLINEKSLVVIGGQGQNNLYKGGMVDTIRPMGNFKTQVRIFDISDKKKPFKIRSLEIVGEYSQARMINSSVYIVSNKYISYSDDKLEDKVPTYKDSLTGDKVNSISYDNIGYCKEALEPNYLMITSLDLNNIKGKANITTVLGSGTNIYASENNIYMAGGNRRRINNQEDKTTIYKFKINKASTSFVTSGVVKGSTLNQFSMDESKGYFRIATTENAYNINKSKNNLFVLNSEMKVVGKLEGLAPTERIYSARFMGDRAYMVTFKQQDPLFVIDLKTPEAPKILGELKIPGFSNYLEPYDENHLLGFGQDSVDVKEGDNILSKPIGMKIAMFDVTDVAKPIEKFQAKIGRKNSYSQVLNNHKALLFSKENNLIAFPVQYSIGKMGYYQGACVYNVDLKTGFTLKGNITHNDIKGPQGEKANIDRELYIGENIYTISNLAIKANNLQTLKEVGRLKIGDAK